MDTELYVCEFCKNIRDEYDIQIRAIGSKERLICNYCIDKYLEKDYLVEYCKESPEYGKLNQLIKDEIKKREVYYAYTKLGCEARMKELKAQIMTLVEEHNSFEDTLLNWNDYGIFD